MSVAPVPLLRQQHRQPGVLDLRLLLGLPIEPRQMPCQVSCQKRRLVVRAVVRVHEGGEVVGSLVVVGVIVLLDLPVGSDGGGGSVLAAGRNVGTLEDPVWG